jgi:hypothetical protein
MKILKSLPKQTAFFNRYAALTHSLSRFAVVAQVVTGAAEIGIIYAMLYPSVVDLIPSYAVFISSIGSVFCASLLQVGLKKLFPYSVRAILYRRFSGLDLSFSIAVFILTAALLTVSVFLSWNGAKDIATFAVAPPQYKTTLKQDSTKAATKQQATSIFSTDSATIETKYKGKMEAIESEYQSRIGGFESKAATTVYKSPLWSKELKAKAENQKAELKTKLATLQSDKAVEIESKATERKQAINKALERHETETTKIDNDNHEAKETAKLKEKRYSGYIGYFTLFCYVFFLCAYILNEIYHKGAKIDLTPTPDQRHFLPSVITEFIEAAKAKIDYFFRSKIQRWADKTPPTPLPNALPVLYEFNHDTFKNTWKVETDTKEAKVIKLPSKVVKIASEKQETTTQEQPRQIGFFKGTDNNENRNTKIVSETPKNNAYENRVCAFCNGDYVHKHHKQKYCSDVCRISSWEQSKGRKLYKK